MKRTTVALTFIIIAMAGFAGACGDDSNAEKHNSLNAYCAELPSYFKSMAEGMNKDVEDPRRYDDWAAEAKKMRAIAPDELHSSWEFLVDYSSRAAAKATDISFMKDDDPKRNGDAGKAILEHAQKNCGMLK